MRETTMAKITIPLGDNRSVYLDLDHVLANEVVLPGDRYPRKRRLWVVVNEYGALGAVFADDMQEALDVLVDADLGKGLLVDEDYLKGLGEEERENLAYLGNAGEPADLSNVDVIPVPFDLTDRHGPEMKAATLRLLLRLAEARGAGADTLADL
jgi:hypothetical protein